MKTLYKEDVFEKSQQIGLIKEENVLKKPSLKHYFVILYCNGHCL